MVSTRIIDPVMFFGAFGFNLELFGLQYMLMESSRNLYKSRHNISSLMTTVSENGSQVINGTLLERLTLVEATKWNIYSNTTFGILAMLLANIYGVISDMWDVKHLTSLIMILHLIPAGILVLVKKCSNPLTSLRMGITFMTMFGVLGGSYELSTLCSSYILKTVASQTSMVTSARKSNDKVDLSSKPANIDKKTDNCLRRTGIMENLRSKISKGSLQCDKTTKLGILEAINVFGTMLPNILAGVILDNLNFYYIPLLTGCSIVISIIYSVIFVKTVGKEQTQEDVNGDRQTEVPYIHRGLEAGRKKRNSSMLKSTAKLVFRRRRTGIGRMILWVCLFGVLVTSVSVLGGNGLIYLYLRGPPIGFTNSEVGAYQGVSQMLNGVGLIVLLPIMKRYFQELTICLITLTARCLLYLILGTVQSKHAIFATLSLAICCGMEIPLFRTYADYQVDQDEKGRLMGLVASMQGLGFLISQFLVLHVYIMTLEVFRGIAYILCAILCASLVPLIFVTKIMEERCRRRHRGHTSVETVIGPTDTSK